MPLWGFALAWRTGTMELVRGKSRDSCWIYIYIYILIHTINEIIAGVKGSTIDSLWRWYDVYIPDDQNQRRTAQLTWSLRLIKFNLLSRHIIRVHRHEDDDYDDDDPHLIANVTPSIVSNRKRWQIIIIVCVRTIYAFAIDSVYIFAKKYRLKAVFVWKLKKTLWRRSQSVGSDTWCKGRTERGYQRRWRELCYSDCVCISLIGIS